MNKLSFLVIAAGLSFASAASADHPGHGGHCMMHKKGGYFTDADTNNDGSIDKAEAQAFHEQRFDEMDVNHDGKLDHDEISAGMRRDRHAMGTRGFMGADKDNDGTLDKTEAEQLPRVHQHFDEIDVDKDGTVSRDEVHNYMRDHR